MSLYDLYNDLQSQESTIITNIERSDGPLALLCEKPPPIQVKKVSTKKEEPIINNFSVDDEKELEEDEDS